MGLIALLFWWVSGGSGPPPPVAIPPVCIRGLRVTRAEVRAHAPACAHVIHGAPLVGLRMDAAEAC